MSLLFAQPETYPIRANILVRASVCASFLPLILSLRRPMKGVTTVRRAGHTDCLGSRELDEGHFKAGDPVMNAEIESFRGVIERNIWTRNVELDGEEKC